MRNVANIVMRCLAMGLSSVAVAQPDPSGIEFVTIGDVGNAAWEGAGRNNGRGSVGYEYKIGKFEVTTSQWVEFMNAAFDRPTTDRIPHVWSPFVWGAQGATPQTPGGQRWSVVPGREMWGTGGVDWRTCAIYCNWLHNGKSSDRAAFMSGAYDVSTFGYPGGGSLFSDQLTRSPGAQYWIPSLDEWMKAAHYDPNRNGEGQGGWWTYSNGSEMPFVYGPPGTLVNGVPATANAGWSGDTHPGFNPYAVPLGSYDHVMSAYGLFDLAGGVSEWTEHTFWLRDESLPRDRIFKGSAWDLAVDPSQDSATDRGGGLFPSFAGSDTGFRVASIPSPSTWIVGLAAGGYLRHRKRTR